LKEAGVDMVLNGHVHAYERNLGVSNYTIDPCAPVFITVGDGGNLEGLYTAFIETEPVAAFCSNASLYKLPSYQPSPSGSIPITYPKAFNNSFCPQSQPEYSAFRDPAFGSGQIEVFNATHMQWEWFRTMPGQPELIDSVMLVKNPECPNQMGGLLMPASGDTPSMPGNMTDSTMPGGGDGTAGAVAADVIAAVSAVAPSPAKSSGSMAGAFYAVLFIVMSVVLN